MKASELIELLQNYMIEYGDLPIVFGYAPEDSSPRNIWVALENGEEVGSKLNEEPVVYVLEG